ncbi:MAG: Crp/Fnr family transcriptional regulator [Saprospiraceae bacterium]
MEILLKKHATEEESASLIFMLSQALPLSKQFIKYAAEHTFPLCLKKGKTLLKPGEICTHIFFVKSGILRCFIKDENKEITTWITAEGEMVASISSFIYQRTSMESIQAVEDCDLLALSYTDMEQAYLKFPHFNIIARKLYEKYYVDAENRALIARLKNAQKKYHHFLNFQGHLANRVPLKYIASYIGIRLETLSRIRAKRSFL